jgi:peroxiredoxin
VKRARRSLLALLSVLAVLFAAGCSTGNDATVYGGSFTFTSPGGLKEFTYPASDRKTIGPISGPDLTGKQTIDVAAYRGKVVVLNFWGSWCAPCRAEADGLEYSWQTYQSQPVQFLGVNVRDPDGAGLAFATSKKITYPSILDFSMRTLLSLRGVPTGSMPVTVVLDKQGRVAHIWLHDITQADLNQVLPALVKEA